LLIAGTKPGDRWYRERLLLTERREEILAALDAVISDIGEERLRSYRVNLRHL
jgi:hypothetical protein